MSALPPAAVPPVARPPAAGPPPLDEAWRDAGRDPRERVEDLLARLTPPERIGLLHQHTPAIPRLGLKAFHTGTEALHGVAWLGEATVFPQAVGLGATWHPELLRRVGTVVGTEVRAKHAADPAVSLNVWAPVVNLLRDPRWGRNEEGYAEDPFLTTRLAIAYCRGLRGDHPRYVRVAPTLKHFLAYNNETDRDLTSSDLRPRVLHEYDLPVFRDPIAAGVVDAVMPSYNLVNGRPSHVGPLLAQVHGWAPHEVLVVSDAGAPSNLVEREGFAPDHPTGHAAALRAGVDSLTDQDARSAVVVDRIAEALARGLLTGADVDRAARRVLALRLRTGEFDPHLDPWAGIGTGDLDRPGHRELARRAAREQVVLLRHEGGLLPLSPASRIGVVGPLADTLCADWYSGTMPYRVTVAAGLRAAVAGHGGDVATADGLDRIALRSRVTGHVAATPAGIPALTCADGLTVDDPAAWFDVADHGQGVVTLRSVATGRYVTAGDGAALVADREEPGGWVVQETFALLPQDGGGLVVRHVASGAYVRRDPATGALAATAEHPDDAEPFERHAVRDGVRHALEAVAGCDAVVVVLGNDPHIHGRETEDRTTLALPPAQERLLRAVAAAHPRVVLLVTSSYPYALTWADEHVPAVLWSSHAGQETGHAVADVLLGRHAPTGRLPQTWYRADADLPDLLDYDVIGSRQTYQYTRATPLYPFGHGLTYTTFGHGPATAILHDDEGDTVTVTVDVTNTGSRAGVEVVQLYSRATGDIPDRPRRRLQAFERVALAAGETRRVTLAFPLAGLAHWDVVTHALRVDPGPYELLVGRSATDVVATAVLQVPGEPAGPRPVGGADVAAVDLDDHHGIRIVEGAHAAGDAVEGSDGAWIAFRRAALPTGAGRLTLTAAREAPGTAAVEVRLDGPAGPLLGTVEVPSTGSRRAWRAVTGDVTSPGGVRDLYLVLGGAVRLDTVRLDTEPAGGGPA